MPCTKLGSESQQKREKIMKSKNNGKNKEHFI
jgi:hypothetical protein